MVERHVVKRGVGEGEAEGNRTEFVPVQVERGVEGRLGREKKGADGSVAQHLGRGFAGGEDSGEPEDVEAVAEFSGPLFRPLVIEREMGIVPPSFLGGEVGQPTEVGEEAGRALGVFVGGEGGQEGVWDVFEPVDHPYDLLPGLFRDAGVVLERTGDGGVVHPRLFGYIR